MAHPAARLVGHHLVPPDGVVAQVPLPADGVDGHTLLLPGQMNGHAPLPPRQVAGPQVAPPHDLVGVGVLPPRRIAGLGAEPPMAVEGGAPLPPNSLVGRVRTVPAGIDGHVRPPPEGLQGRVHLPPAALAGQVQIPVWHRIYDFILALTVWINTWGQAIYQNQTPKFLGQSVEHWKNELKDGRAVAWKEVTLCWSAMWSCKTEQEIDVDFLEANHATDFVALVRKMSNTQRLLCKYDALKDEDPEEVTPPLSDTFLKWYTKKYYGLDGLDPHTDPFLLPRV